MRRQTASFLLQSSDKKRGKRLLVIIANRVEAHPGHGEPALDGRVDDDAAVAPSEVGQRGVGRVHVAPEVDVHEVREGRGVAGLLEAEVVAQAHGVHQMGSAARSS